MVKNKLSFFFIDSDHPFLRGIYHIIPATPVYFLVMQRWKEQYFVNVGTDCGLTIAGFYYVCFSCSDGSISGFYYDPNSRLVLRSYLMTQTIICFCCLCIEKLIICFFFLASPFQKLELKTVNEGRTGFSFSSYELQ